MRAAVRRSSRSTCWGGARYLLRRHLRVDAVLLQPGEGLRAEELGHPAGVGLGVLLGLAGSGPGFMRRDAVVLA
jgi:hypothetical protein